MSDEKNPLPGQALAPTPAPCPEQALYAPTPPPWAVTAPVADPIADLNLTVDADVIAGMLKKLFACGARYAAINGQERTENTPHEQRRVIIFALMAAIGSCRKIVHSEEACAALEVAVAPLVHLMSALDDIDKRGIVSGVFKPLKPAKAKTDPWSRWEARALLAVAMEIRRRLDADDDKSKAAHKLAVAVPECGAFFAARGRKGTSTSTINRIITVNRIIKNHEMFNAGHNGGEARGPPDGIHRALFKMGLDELDAAEKSLPPPDFQFWADGFYSFAIQRARDHMRREP